MMKVFVSNFFVAVFVFTRLFTQAQVTPVSCDASGNWLFFGNYDGGKLNIVVDQDVPNLKIGICSYEPVTVTFSGQYVGNITDVYYAGYNSTVGNNHCGYSVFTSTFTGINPALVTVDVMPPVNIISPPNPNNFLGSPNGWNTGVVCVYSCDINNNQGGCNTIDQVLDVFQTRFGGLLRGMEIQYCCWLENTPYRVSKVTGKCCNSFNGNGIASINYPQGPFCDGSGSIDPNLQGDSSGTFYANNPGLDVNPATGVINFNASNPGTYLVTYAIAINCTSYIYTDTVTIIGGGSQTTINDSACVSYIAPWGNVYSQSGIYADTISTTSGCDSIITLNLTILESNPQFQIVTDDSDICLQNNLSLNINGNETITSVLWNFGDPLSGNANSSTSFNPSHSFSDTGTYNISCIVNYNCGSDTINKIISVSDCSIETQELCKLFIPNTFTPNADGKNDLFKLVTNCELLDYEFLIFNRWGELIFKSNNYSETWDGKYNNQDCQMGLYIYSLSYRFTNMSFDIQYGSINLMR